MELRSERFRRRRNLFPQRKLHVRENHAVFRGLPFCFQAIDFRVRAGDLPLQFPDVSVRIGLLFQELLQAPQRALCIAQARFKVRALLSDFVRRLLFLFNLAKRFAIRPLGPT
jgi:hypothetical protein